MGGIVRATTSSVARRRELGHLAKLIGPGPPLDPSRVLLIGHGVLAQRDGIDSIPRLDSADDVPSGIDWVVFAGPVAPIRSDWLSHLLRPEGDDVRTAPILAPQTAPRRPLVVVARGWLLGREDGTPTPVAIAPGSDPESAVAARHLAELAHGSLVAVRPDLARQLVGITPPALGGAIAALGRPVDVVGPAAVVSGDVPTWTDLPMEPPTATTSAGVDRTVVDLTTPDLAQVREGTDLSPAIGQRLTAGPVSAGLAGDWIGYRSESTTSTQRISVRVAPPTRQVAERWGDTHLARGLARALGRHGRIARVATRDEWVHPHFDRTDVVVHVRGLERFSASQAATNVLWVISHPSEVGDRELDEADVVLVASMIDAERLAERTSTPVMPFLQATDPATEVGERTNPPIVRFVGNTVGRTRPAVAAAVSAGVPVRVNGTGWEGVPGVEAGPPVPNVDVADLYRGNIVLVDHWPDMAAAGYVNNRVFDAFAAGGIPISDDVVGMEHLIDGLVPVWHSPADLAATIARLSSASAFEELAGRGRQSVLSSHTFDHRAEALLLILAGRSPDDRLLGLA
jgi:hypothetical protein